MIYNSTAKTRVSIRSRGQRLKRYERRDFKRLFLGHYIQTLNVTASCKAVGVSRAAFYTWLNTDERFKEKYHAITSVYYLSYLPYACTEEQKETHKKREKYGRLLIKRFYQQHPGARPQHDIPMGALALYEAQFTEQEYGLDTSVFDVLNAYV
jgi:hypothetical protein